LSLSSFFLLFIFKGQKENGIKDDGKRLNLKIKM
jgi:hypothetical protein